MDYISTRGQAPALNFEQAATSGLAADGGLYVPSSWPQFSYQDMLKLRSLSYSDLAVEIIAKFTGDSISKADLTDLIKAAYSTFDHPEIAPVRKLSNDRHMLELFHGPTLSFKDYALQFLGKFMDWSLSSHKRNLTIVGATSGDTGSAAICAVTGSSNINLFMLHPFGRVSDMQRRQMTTNQDHNIFNYAVDGTFDDCQAIVKSIFNDPEVLRHYSLGAVNSINWGRITAQIVYYFYAALMLGAPDVPVSFAVPTGNFGNVFAGYSASKMGLPIKHMIICSNENDILTRFFHHGKMWKLGVKQTVTPSMDIEVSSNFERFLFEIMDRNGEKVSQLMKKLALEGEFTVDTETWERAKQIFSAYRVNDKETCEAIATQYQETQQIIDPHTAVALAASNKISKQQDFGPIVVVSTAHPAKFSDTIKRSIGKNVNLPVQLSRLLDVPERYRKISNNAEELKNIMLAS